MRKAIKEGIKDSEDRVRIYLLCDGCRQRTEVLGEGEITGYSETVVV